MSMSSFNQRFIFPDGRVLGYDDYGAATCKPYGRRNVVGHAGRSMIPSHGRLLAVSFPGDNRGRASVARRSRPRYADRNGAFLAAAIPESQAHFYPEEGHLSLFMNYLQDILAVFAADASITV